VEELHPEGSGPLAVALAWSPDLDAGSLKAFLAASHARTSEEIARAWSLYRGPSVNVCWAAAEGHIGLLVAGAIPRRRTGDGRLPVPGWTGSYDWNGLVPPAELPRIEDPPEGFVASANDDWTSSGYRLPYPGEFALRERLDRIRDVLSSLHHAVPSDVRTLQNDLLSLYAIRVRDALLGIGARDPEARRALAILAGWDGRALRRGPTLLFYRFMQDLRQRTFGPREKRLGGRLPAGWDLMATMIEGSGGNDLWDDPGTDAVETREAAISTSLGSALRDVESREGAVPAAWRWGRTHALTYVHPLAEAIPALGRFLNVGPIEMGGDSETVAVSAFSLSSRNSEPWLVVSARLIVDLGDPDRSTLVLPLGESGQFPDRRYDDQAEAWARGGDFPFPYGRTAVDAAAVSTLRLE
jgi:penicillin amidase